MYRLAVILLILLCACSVRREEKEKKRIELENSLNRITSEADKNLGLKEILPGLHKKGENKK